MKIIFFPFIFLIAFCGCKNQKFAKVASQSIYTIADSNGTAAALLKEDNEGYFAKLQAIDVAIQLKDNAYLNDVNYLLKYRNYLKEQASNFESDEQKKISEVTDEAITLIKKINPQTTTNFQLCKIKTAHYGNDVYYTRGNAIFIPDNIFSNFKKEEQMPIILHEIWHIISEAKPALRDKLYKLIGFVKHNKKITYPLSLKKMMLTNPDGANDEYAIVLKGGKLAMPIILSGKQKYDPANPAFFNHLKFELFGIDKLGNIEMNDDLTSSLTNEEQASFFLSIKDNTQYIIHPDEIIADNFMLAVLAYSNGDYSKFNKSGKELIEQVIAVLKSN